MTNTKNLCNIKDCMHIGIMSRNIRRDMGPRYAYVYLRKRY
nr:MAG TPA: hypothetical protein [Caudoviricetes sp.]